MTTLTVGSGQEFSTITAAVAAAHTGDTIDVQAGTYTNDFPGLINGLTIEGVGGQVHLVATAQPGNGKAIFDVAGNTTLRNLDFSGASVNDGNGAGVRYESGNLVIQNSSFENNQDGILGASDPNGSITIDHSEFSDNGAGDGRTHNIYIGDIQNFTLTNSYIHDSVVGHEVKSRAETNVITGNRIYDNSGDGSYSIDLPNGGNATIDHNVIEKGANAQNGTIIAYAEEGGQHAGTSVSVTNNEVVNDRYNANAIWNAAGSAMTVSGNTEWNLPGQTAGFTALQSRPTLDMSSPITTASTAPALTPALLRIVGNRDGGVTVLGTSAANSTVTITDTSAGTSRVLGTATASASGAFSMTTHSKVSVAAVNVFSASATDGSGGSGSSSGLFQLSSAGNDALSGTTGQADVFATFLRTGQDTINGFETTRAVGAAHDVINLSGTGYGYYGQVASHISGTANAVIQLDATRSVTLMGVAASSLQASDFRFS